MKGLKIGLAIAAAAALTIGLSGATHAFHSGGVAECEGCHSMHKPKAGGSFMLVDSNQSETCLTCHQGETDTGPSNYHVSTTGASIAGQPLQRTPGGDFGWLKKTFSYSYTSGGVTTNYSETGGGHNIIAPSRGYNVDSHNDTAPGGTFPSAQLQCNSCHDPHGQYRRKSDGTIAKTGAPIIGSGSYDNSTEPSAGKAVGVYRLLAGAGYTKDGVTFNGVPVAKAPSTYNRTEASTQTRVAYGLATTGGHVSWGAWCATCHGDMHGAGKYVHPSDSNLGSTIATTYGQYVKSGDLTGSSDSSFLSLVPFIEGTGDYAALALNAKNNDTKLGGPSTSDQVSCLSCHRAHASGWSHMLRFDQGYEFMTKAAEYVASDNTAVGNTGRGPLQHRGRTIADAKAAYYDRPASKFADYQRVLCNKCHAKD